MANETPPADDRTGSRSRWLSINEACALLGVDQSTLRRWSDAGKVPVFRTPGGHRRYAENDLRALIGASPQRQDRQRSHQQELTNRSLLGYEEEFWRGARERRWLKAYAAAGKDDLRALGRRMVDLAVQSASLPATSDRSALFDEGRAIGGQYGQFGARAGLSAVETVEAFLYFRSPVVQSIMSMIDDQRLAAKRAARLFVGIGEFLDQVLIATVAAHETHAPRELFPLPAPSLDLSAVTIDDM